jgi:hypothetical protein
MTVKFTKGLTVLFIAAGIWTVNAPTDLSTSSPSGVPQSLQPWTVSIVISAALPLKRGRLNARLVTMYELRGVQSSLQSDSKTPFEVGKKVRRIHETTESRGAQYI